ncbi:hypothetical protein ACR8AY_10625 [Clavibacter sepedonicus]|uniref:Membrane protein n=1 Tax=Clavibacter sepedonicus TaxID=31964 RepID=B0RJ75_CLASE|nr:hypothetical protein B5P19_15215 [Clavibacter sepedonicus]OQJ50993.1 hypothetical protein B5P20_15550 [Clavibacter sepedonicus]UUK67350.1 hypothetical protein LRE50_16455 [Clavibacter sepedonicus]CAQ03265.1 putative membrane protein [Clavibacter sepedonicus]
MTDIGTPATALLGLGILALSSLARIALRVGVKRTLVRATSQDAMPGRQWIYLLYALELAAFGAGVVLAHSPMGVAAAVLTAVAATAIASSVLVRMATQAGSGSAFIDTVGMRAYR